MLIIRKRALPLPKKMKTPSDERIAKLQARLTTIEQRIAEHMKQLTKRRS